MKKKDKYHVYIMDDLELFRPPTMPIKIGVIRHNDEHYDSNLLKYEVFDDFDNAEKYVEFVRETYFKQIDKLGDDYKKAVRQIMNERKKNMLKDLRKLKLKKIEKF